MKITLVAVGRLRAGPEKALADHFMGRLTAWDGIADLAFAIGGADGLSDAVRKKARLTMCFGAMTWPHFVVRGLLFEQLYRAQQIIAGHPYHRD